MKTINKLSTRLIEIIEKTKRQSVHLRVKVAIAVGKYSYYLSDLRKQNILSPPDQLKLAMFLNKQLRKTIDRERTEMKLYHYGSFGGSQTYGNVDHQMNEISSWSSLIAGEVLK